MSATASAPRLTPQGDEPTPSPSSGDGAGSSDSVPSSAPVVLLGNPNVGKTSLFNRLAGQRAPVGNYPGVTVEWRSGRVQLTHGSIDIIDVPGTYSLVARSEDERVAIAKILGWSGHERPGLAVIAVDANQLVRNLYLVLQVLELGVPAVVAVNVIDEVAERPNLDALQAFLGVPCVATSARTGEGLDDLRAAIESALSAPPANRVHVRYPDEVRTALDRVADALPDAWRGSVERDRALAAWALTSLDDDDELDGIPEPLRDKARHVYGSIKDLDLQIVGARYQLLDEHAPKIISQGAPASGPPLTERVDRVLLHPVLGFVVFLGVMLAVFQSLFSWADPAIGAVEWLIGVLQDFAGSTLPAGLLNELVVQGVLGGVGNVIVFLPQILLLFLFIGFLEDSGYMARVGYLMDRVMRGLGLHGRAFVPMLSGFACAVPAILATRTMDRKRDRLLTMMVVPLMTCSARLPVYTLIIAALFPPQLVGGKWVQGLLMVSMYVFSALTAMLAAAVLGRTVIPGRSVPLLLELPPYRVPRIRETLLMMTEKSGQFLREAGSVILVCTIGLWALLSFPRTEVSPETAAVSAPTAESSVARADIEPPAVQLPVDEQLAAVDATDDSAESTADVSTAPALADSYGGRLGKWIEPAVAPLGFDWKIATAIVGAFAAREVFISTMGLIFGIDGADEEPAPLRERIRAEKKANGEPAYTPLVGLSLMVFFALACQCMSTLAVVRRESKSWRWPLFLFTYMTVLAYVASLLIYQGGRLLGLA